MAKTKAPKKVFASAYLFPVAALYAAFILPWALLALLWQVPAPAGLLSIYGHAHELIAGYALLVIAGYLLGRIERNKLFILLASWAAARVSFLLWPGGWFAVLTTLVTVALLGYWIVPRFSKSAKKWRNKSVAPLLTLLFLLVLLVALVPWHMHTLLTALLIGLCLLMFFMGGRVLAPAIAGHLIRQNITMPHRVQPAIEGAVIVCLFLALLAFLLGAAWLAGLLLLFSGGLTTVRMARWQLWRCTDRPDLLLLALGYGWLAMGLLTLGLAFMGVGLLTTAVHMVTVGALGTLSVAIMGRTHLVRRFRDPNASRWAHMGALLVSLAAATRVLPVLFAAHNSTSLLLAALLWWAGFMCVLMMFWHSREVLKAS